VRGDDGGVLRAGATRRECGTAERVASGIGFLVLGPG
jgi:hypothetical protein